MNKQIFRMTKCLNVALRLPYIPFFVYGSSEGFDETVHMCWLDRAFNVPICDKYKNLMAYKIYYPNPELDSSVIINSNMF